MRYIKFLLRLLKMARNSEWNLLFSELKRHFIKSMSVTTRQDAMLPLFAESRTAIALYPPAVFSFELTNRCPFKCIMCARTNNMSRSQGIMDFLIFKKAVDEFVDVNPEFAKNEEVWLHGFGESLLHPQFGKFIRYAVSKGINAGLSINPLMLTDKKATELLDAGPAHLLISLDGHDDESFERIRGIRNAYSKSKQRLLTFLEKKEKTGHTIKTTLSMIDFPDNKESIRAKKHFWIGVAGIDHFIAKPFTTWDGNAEDVKQLVKKERYRKTSGKVSCNIPWRTMSLTWDGDLVPCCLDYDKRYVLGNISRDTLCNIWNGTRMLALREEFISNKIDNPLCKKCDYL